VKTYTEKQVRQRLKAFVGRYQTANAAADAIGCTPSQLSLALKDGPIAGKVLAAVKLQRAKVYADV